MSGLKQWWLIIPLDSVDGLGSSDLVWAPLWLPSASWPGLGSARLLAETSHLSSPLRGSKSAKIEVTRSFKTYLVSHVESCLWPRFLGNSRDQPSLGRNGGGGETLPPDGRNGKIILRKGCRMGATVWRALETIYLPLVFIYNGERN